MNQIAKIPKQYRYKIYYASARHLNKVLPIYVPINTKSVYKKTKKKYPNDIVVNICHSIIYRLTTKSFDISFKTKLSNNEYNKIIQWNNEVKIRSGELVLGQPGERILTLSYHDSNNYITATQIYRKFIYHHYDDNVILDNSNNPNLKGPVHLYFSMYRLSYPILYKSNVDILGFDIVINTPYTIKIDHTAKLLDIIILMFKTQNPLYVTRNWEKLEYRDIIIIVK